MTAQQRMFPARSPLPLPLVPDLRIDCAWCQGTIREGVEPTSHGICVPCAQAWRIAGGLPPRVAS